MNNKISIIYLSIILFSLIGVLAESPEAPLTYNLKIGYDDGELSLESMTLEYAYPPEQSSLRSHYIIKLFDIKYREIYNNTFTFPLEVSRSASGCIDDDGLYDAIKCGGSSYERYNNVFQEVAVPYSFTGDIIEVYSFDNELKLVINVSEYAEYCGDGRCTESYWSCPQDCEATAEDKATLTEYEKGYDAENHLDKSTILDILLRWKIYIIAAVILALTFILMGIRHKNKVVNKDYNQRPPIFKP